jgi:DNA modification methylase
MIICGDCLEEMAKMESNSIDSIVTDPPYGLSFMGKDWDYGIPGIHFWVEALRVAKPGCHLLAFGGTRTFHRLACAIEDSGWEIRDCLGWIYGSGFPKSHNLKGDHEGLGTALKPAWEPIIMARKPLDGTVAANVQKWGTGAINVYGCRVGPSWWRNNQSRSG